MADVQTTWNAPRPPGVFVKTKAHRSAFDEAVMSHDFVRAVVNSSKAELRRNAIDGCGNEHRAAKGNGVWTNSVLAPPDAQAIVRNTFVDVVDVAEKQEKDKTMKRSSSEGDLSKSSGDSEHGGNYWLPSLWSSSSGRSSNISNMLKEASMETAPWLYNQNDPAALMYQSAPATQMFNGSDAGTNYGMYVMNSGPSNAPLFEQWSVNQGRADAGSKPAHNHVMRGTPASSRSDALPAEFVSSSNLPVQEAFNTSAVTPYPPVAVAPSIAKPPGIFQGGPPAPPRIKEISVPEHEPSSHLPSGKQMPPKFAIEHAQLRGASLSVPNMMSTEWGQNPANAEALASAATDCTPSSLARCSPDLHAQVTQETELNHEMSLLVSQVHAEMRGRVPLERLVDMAQAGILAAIPRNGANELSSAGSIHHAEGTCTPCAYWFKGICKYSISCHYCHFVHDGQKSKRLRPSKQTRMRIRRWEAQVTDDTVNRVNEKTLFTNLDSDEHGLTESEVEYEAVVDPDRLIEHL